MLNRLLGEMWSPVKREGKNTMRTANRFAVSIRQQCKALEHSFPFSILYCMVAWKRCKVAFAYYRISCEKINDQMWRLESDGPATTAAGSHNNEFVCLAPKHLAGAPRISSMCPFLLSRMISVFGCMASRKNRCNAFDRGKSGFCCELIDFMGNVCCNLWQ